MSDGKAQVSYDYDTGCITTFLISTGHREDTSVMDIRPPVEAVMETAGKIKNDNMSDQDFYRFWFIGIKNRNCIEWYCVFLTDINRKKTAVKPMAVFLFQQVFKKLLSRGHNRSCRFN